MAAKRRKRSNTPPVLAKETRGGYMGAAVGAAIGSLLGRRVAEDPKSFWRMLKDLTEMVRTHPTGDIDEMLREGMGPLGEPPPTKSKRGKKKP